MKQKTEELETEKLTVPKTSLTSTDANSHESAGKLQEKDKKTKCQIITKYI